MAKLCGNQRKGDGVRDGTMAGTPQGKDVRPSHGHICWKDVILDAVAFQFAHFLANCGCVLVYGDWHFEDC
jgi:hypothetical protein